MIIVSSLFFIYVITILVFVYGFNQVNDFTLKNIELKTKFSIVIPFRNEADNLPTLLKSIDQLDYPMASVEFIFIDDASTDNSIDLINNHFDTRPNIQIIANQRISNSPKKDAITAALQVSTHEWIVTTDADCILPKKWLQIFAAFIQQNNCNLVVAPVTYIANKKLLHQFQLLDFLSLQAATISGFGLQQPFLCNGANLAYKKDVFKKVNGFKNNNSIASGDDIFILEKFLKFDKTKVKYLKSTEAIVKTFPVNTVSQLLNQRIRWASKTASYNLVFGKLIGVVILLGNASIAAIPFLLVFSTISVTTAITYFLLKVFSDAILIKKVAQFYKQKTFLSSYLISSLYYPGFTITVFLKSLFSNYNWKGRTFKK